MSLAHAVCLVLLSMGAFLLTAQAGYRFALQGHAALVQGDYGGAVRWLNRAVSLRRTDADSWFNLGDAYRGNRLHNEAIAAYEEAIRLNANRNRGRDAIAACKADLAYEAQCRGDLEGAVALYRQSVDFDDSQPTVWYNLGTAYAASGDLEAARAAMEKAQQLDPGDATVRNALGALKRKAVSRSSNRP